MASDATQWKLIGQIGLVAGNAGGLAMRTLEWKFRLAVIERDGGPLVGAVAASAVIAVLPLMHIL